MFKVLFSFFLLFSPSAFAETPDQSHDFVKCEFKGLVRTILVKKSKGCEVIYTKIVSGQLVKQTIGTGSVPGNCYRFVDNVRSNLEAADWRCRGFSNFKIVSE